MSWEWWWCETKRRGNATPWCLGTKGHLVPQCGNFWETQARPWRALARRKLGRPERTVRMTGELPDHGNGGWVSASDDALRGDAWKGQRHIVHSDTGTKGSPQVNTNRFGVLSGNSVTSQNNLFSKMSFFIKLEILFWFDGLNWHNVD